MTRVNAKISHCEGLILHHGRKDVPKLAPTYRLSDGRSASLGDFIRREAEVMRRNGRISRARGFTSVLSKLDDFTGGAGIPFGDIDAGFIDRFSEWLGCGATTASTQSFYLRTLRSILNRAGAEGLIDPAPEWFRGVNTSIDRSRTRTLARVLDRPSLQRIAALDLRSDRQLALVRDMFMFAFYCRGMELVEVAHLTAANLHDGHLVYRRRLKGALTTVPLGSGAAAILRRYSSDTSSYLFPLLADAGPVLFASVRNTVAGLIKTVGRRAGCPCLSFSMNIGSWHALMSEANISQTLLL